MNLKEKARQLKTDIPAVFLALSKRETPLLAKLIAALTVIYALSPTDLIPDFIPVLGYLDDLLILPGMVALTIKLIPEDVFEECRVESAGLWDNGTPRKWYFALPVALFWVACIFYIWRIVASQ